MHGQEDRPVGQLEALRPKAKTRIMDIVEAVGIDVSEWKASGASNPKYCYQWGFANDSKTLIVLCLWYDDCEVDDSGIHQAWNFRDYIRRMEADGGPKAARARQVDLLLQDAWRLRVPIRVAIVDETPAKKASKKPDDTSQAAFRELDPVEWHVAEYDWMTGACTLRRGPTSSSVSSSQRREGQAAPESTTNKVDIGLAADILEQAGRTDITTTTRDALVSARIGQGAFRGALLAHWDSKCAVTQCSELALLRASHVKPWRASNDMERLDPSNGLLLTANLDALFDRGLISFDDEGTMLLSPRLTTHIPDVTQTARLQRTLTTQQKQFLAVHRRDVFQSFTE